jgi:hypothetical protein
MHEHWRKPHCFTSTLLLDRETCATERVDESDLCASLRPKDGSVASPDKSEAKAAGQPEVGLDSGDVNESDLHWRKKPIGKPSRADPDAVRAQFKSRQPPAEIRATREEVMLDRLRSTQIT